MQRFHSKVFAISFLIISGCFSAVAQTTDFQLPTGTKIRLRMDNALSSRNSSKDDTFTATVEESVTNGNAVLPKGAVFHGLVSRSRSAGFNGRNGVMELQFVKVRFETQEFPVSARLLKSFAATSGTAARSGTVIGGTGLGAALGGFSRGTQGALIGSAIGFGIGGLAAYAQKGVEAEITTKEIFEIELLKPLSLPVDAY